MDERRIDELAENLVRAVDDVCTGLGQLRHQIKIESQLFREDAGRDLVGLGAAVEFELSRRTAIAARVYVSMLAAAVPHFHRDVLTDAQEAGVRMIARHAWTLAEILLDAEPGPQVAQPAAQEGGGDEPTA